MIEKYEDLSEQQLDVLAEVGNIGSGNAATALSSLIGREILIELPAVRLIESSKVIEQIGSAEDVVCGILVRIKGDIEGMILFIVEKAFADIVLDAFFQEKRSDLLNLSENEVSALAETGNIMASSYVSAIAHLAGMEIAVEAPSLAVDMLGSLMSVPVIEFGEVGDKLLWIEKLMKIDNVSIKSNMMLIPTVDSLATLLAKLGVL